VVCITLVSFYLAVIFVITTRSS